VGRTTIVLLACWVMGCDSSPIADARATLRQAATFKASCHVAELGVCREYTDEAMGLGESLTQRGCLDEGGVWSPAHCPPERRLGACTSRGGVRVYYSGGPASFTRTSAARDCLELYQGTFVAH